MWRDTSSLRVCSALYTLWSVSVNWVPYSALHAFVIFALRSVHVGAVYTSSCFMYRYVPFSLSSIVRGRSRSTASSALAVNANLCRKKTNHGKLVLAECILGLFIPQARLRPEWRGAQPPLALGLDLRPFGLSPVSYTHLTLPTILRV